MDRVVCFLVDIWLVCLVEGKLPDRIVVLLYKGADLLANRDTP